MIVRLAIGLTCLETGSWWRSAAGSFFEVPAVYSTKPGKLMEWAHLIGYDGVQLLPMHGVQKLKDLSYILTCEGVWTPEARTLWQRLQHPMEWMLFLAPPTRDEVLAKWQDLGIPRVRHDFSGEKGDYIEIRHGIEDVHRLNDLIVLAETTRCQYVADMRHLLELHPEGSYLKNGEKAAHGALHQLEPHISRIIHLQPPVFGADQFFSDPVNTPTGRIFIHALQIVQRNHKAGKYGAEEAIAVAEYLQGARAIAALSNRRVIGQATSMYKAMRLLCQQVSGVELTR